MKEIKDFIQELCECAKSVTAAEFTYRGHSYIWFHHPGGWDGNDGIVHNPDCKCSKK